MGELAALVVAPVLGLVGVYIGFILNARREDRALRRELALARYREGQALFDELISSAGRRFTALQRWLRSVEDPASYREVPARADYFALVQDWNAACWSRRARLRLMLGDAVAFRFLDYGDDERAVPASLHYQFVAAHAAVRRAEVGEGTTGDAQRLVDALNHAWSDFADAIAVELGRRADELARPA